MIKIDILLISVPIVREKLRSAIASSIHSPDLQAILLEFIETKEHYQFGQLTYLHYQLFGGAQEIVYDLAAAVEMLAISFDILDDLQDQDNFDEPWMKKDPSVAMNAATSLYTLSYQQLITLDHPHKEKLLYYLQKYALQAMEGQHADLTNSSKTEEECLYMMQRKSGSLIAVSSVLGVIGATGEHLQEVEEYAYQIGIAAQAENDFRDLFNGSKSDVVLGRKTLALLYLEKRFNHHAEELLAFYQSQQTFLEKYGTINAYKQKLFESGVSSYLNVMRQISLKKAEKLISELPLNSNQRESLQSHLIIKN
ncbi:polyprenyl synthetase family protein [Metabacillus lacus]|uniref:polyprenyl synthetase family protein n=1 Tax=Metabacillus lacus TaxID=1983721 RepID=UPI0012B0D505